MKKWVTAQNLHSTAGCEGLTSHICHHWVLQIHSLFHIYLFLNIYFFLFSIHYIISIFMINFSLFILITVANLYAASQLSQDANMVDFFPVFTLTAMLTDVMLTVGHTQLGSWVWPPSTGVQNFRHSFINTCSLWFFSMDIFTLFRDHL